MSAVVLPSPSRSPRRPPRPRSRVRHERRARPAAQRRPGHPGRRPGLLDALRRHAGAGAPRPRHLRHGQRELELELPPPPPGRGLRRLHGDAARPQHRRHPDRREYVVNAVRRMAAMAGGRQVDMLGHSQGGLQPRWVTRCYPGDPGPGRRRRHPGRTAPRHLGRLAPAPELRRPASRCAPSSAFIARPELRRRDARRRRLHVDLDRGRRRAGPAPARGVDPRRRGRQRGQPLDPGRLRARCPSSSTTSRSRPTPPSTTWCSTPSPRTGRPTPRRAEPDCLTPFFVYPGGDAGRPAPCSRTCSSDPTVPDGRPGPSPSPRPPTTPTGDGPTFTDVPAEHWAYWEIEWAASRGSPPATPTASRPDRPVEPGPGRHVALAPRRVPDRIARVRLRRRARRRLVPRRPRLGLGRGHRPRLRGRRRSGPGAT